MEKETHIYLADKIHESLMLSFPVTFSRELFRTANLRPDQSLLSFLHPHFAELSFAYIEKQAALLATERLFIGNIVQSDFVIRLGWITHYLCDFFCHVHIGSHLLRIREHITYETRLNQVVLEQPGFFEKIYQSALVPTIQHEVSLRQLYDQCLHHYLKQPAGFERDMKTATWISVQAASCIMHQCLDAAGVASLRLSNADSY